MQNIIFLTILYFLCSFFIIKLCKYPRYLLWCFNYYLIILIITQIIITNICLSDAIVLGHTLSWDNLVQLGLVPHLILLKIIIFLSNHLPTSHCVGSTCATRVSLTHLGLHKWSCAAVFGTKMDLFVLHILQMLNGLRAEKKSTLSSLSRFPQIIPEQFLQCSRTHYPADCCCWPFHNSYCWLSATYHFLDFFLVVWIKFHCKLISILKPT